MTERQFVKMVARLDWSEDGDDSIETVNSLIEQARGIVLTIEHEEADHRERR